MRLPDPLCEQYQPTYVDFIFDTQHGVSMTPDKRATLLTAFKWGSAIVIGSALLVGGYITSDVWLAALLGAK